MNVIFQPPRTLIICTDPEEPHQISPVQIWITHRASASDTGMLNSVYMKLQQATDRSDPTITFNDSTSTQHPSFSAKRDLLYGCIYEDNSSYRTQRSVYTPQQNVLHVVCGAQHKINTNSLVWTCKLSNNQSLQDFNAAIAPIHANSTNHHNPAIFTNQSGSFCSRHVWSNEIRGRYVLCKRLGFTYKTHCSTAERS